MSEDCGWDAHKDLINRFKHGIGFSLAQHAFEDPKRVIICDNRHSTALETRYFCLGMVPGIGTQEKSAMKKRIAYTEPDVEITGEVVKDFLPAPSELVFKQAPEPRITITMTKSTVDFFKVQAKKNGTKYQSMIRALLDRYAETYSGKK